MPKKNNKKATRTRKQKIAATQPNDKPAEAGSSSSTFDVKVDYLKTPVKSKNDKKEYRVIKLANGLTALLINYPDPLDDKDKNKEENDASSSRKSSKKGSGQNCRWLEQALKMDDKAYCPASCTLSINVGSLSDPPEYPGMANLIKKVILVGSKKHPETCEFGEFVDKCGGMIITSESHEKTSYFLKVPETHFAEAIDRFAQCFMNPTLLPYIIISEREKIETDRKTHLEFPEYIDRKEHLLTYLAADDNKNPSYKLAPKFAEATFKASNKTVCEEALKFVMRHYSANRMTVIIESRMSLDTLEEYAKACFSRIPNTGLPPDNFSRFNCADCFDMSEWRSLYRMRPVSWKDVNKVELNWPMPSPHRYYKSKPLQYLSWILRHEGEGSLISYLRKQKLCDAIECGFGKTKLEENSVYSIFSLSLIFTGQGNGNFKRILDAVYSYINLMKREGPQKRIFDEIRDVSEAMFNFTSSGDFVPETKMTLCEDMQIYEPSDYLTGDLLYFKYDPNAIKHCMDLLTPDRANIIAYDKFLNEMYYTPKSEEPAEGGICHRMMVYPKTDISEEWISDWKTIEPFPEFSLPETNVFVAHDFTIIPETEDPQLYPVKIHDDDFSEVWYKLGTNFRLPECCINFCFISPLLSESAVNACMLDILVKVLKFLVFKDLFPVTIAGLCYNIQSFDSGLIMQGRGFNQKLPIMMETIVKYLSESSSRVTTTAFATAKNAVFKTYIESLQKTCHLTEDLTLSILKKVHWPWLDKLEAITVLRFDEFKQFLKLFTDRFFVRCLAQGNIAKADIIENVQKCIELLNYKPLLRTEIPQLKIHEIPRGFQCCRANNIIPNCRVTTVKNYYQFEDASIKQFVLIDFLILLLSDPLFLEFNDLDNTGPLLVSRDDSIVPGYSIVKQYLHGHETTTGTTEIETNLSKIRKCFNVLLKHLAPEELLGAKKAFAKIKARKCENFVKEVTRNWDEIVSGHYLFDRKAQELDVIKSMEVEDLRKSLLMLTEDGPDLRTLSVQTVLKTRIEKNLPTIEEDEDKVNVIEFSQCHDNASEHLTAPLKEKVPDRVLITDIKTYKRGLKVFSVKREKDIEELSEKVEQVCKW